MEWGCIYHTNTLERVTLKGNLMASVESIRNDETNTYRPVALKILEQNRDSVSLSVLEVDITGGDENQPGFSGWEELTSHNMDTYDAFNFRYIEDKVTRGTLESRNSQEFLLYLQ